MKRLSHGNYFVYRWELFDAYFEKVEVLDKVKGLLLIPNTELATVKQVANFYEVKEQTIQSLVNDNIIELSVDGFGLFKKDEVVNFLNVPEGQLENLKGKVIDTMGNGDQVIVPNRRLHLFPRRAILRVGMLLESSGIADEVRNRRLMKKGLEMLRIGMAMDNGDLTAEIGGDDDVVMITEKVLLDTQKKIAKKSD